MFSTNSQVLKKLSYFSKVIVRLASGLIETVLWGLSSSNIRQKKPNFFSELELLPFSQKLCFQQAFKSWRNDLSFSTVVGTLASEIKETVPWGLSHSIIGGRIGKNFSSLESLPFFQKNVFSTNSQVLKKWSYFSKLIVTVASELLWTVPWGLSHSIIGGWLGQKLFFTGKFAFLPNYFVFNNLIGPKELILLER